MSDIEAIKQVKARYCRLLDTKDFEGMRRVFTDDVVVDSTGSGGAVITGGDTFVAFLSTHLADVVTVHQCHTPEIALTSPVRRRSWRWTSGFAGCSLALTREQKNANNILFW